MKHRLFIGIIPKLSIIESITRLQQDHLFDPVFRIEQKEKIHLTMTFLGNVLEKNIKEVEEKLDDIIKVHSRAKLVFDNKITLLPNQNLPRVVAIKVHDNKELTWIKREIDSNLNIIENRRFTPHVTLARIKGKIKKSKISELLSLDFNLGSFIVKDIILFESKLYPDGSGYNIRKRFRLRG